MKIGHACTSSQKGPFQRQSLYARVFAQNVGGSVCPGCNSASVAIPARVAELYDNPQWAIDEPEPPATGVRLTV